MEHLARTTLDAAPYEYYMTWNFLNDTMLDFTTSNLEAFFPLMSTEYGENIPIDLNF